VRLGDFGVRICVLGPSGSGKSTLANAIGQLRGLPVVHLDQYRHVAGTRWEIRADEQFAGLHDAAVNTDRWVMDGNYSKLSPQRLARATGVILLDISTARSLARYVQRTRGARPRIGGLEGTADRLSWEVVSYIVRNTRANRRRRRETFDQLDLPKIYLRGPSAVSDFYRLEGLTRPEAT
jgi:adenylate kinase family enzyme